MYGLRCSCRPIAIDDAVNLSTRIANLCEKVFGASSNYAMCLILNAQHLAVHAAEQVHRTNMQSAIRDQNLRIKQALEKLESVMCDPEGELSLGPPWSVGDLVAAKEALDLLRGKRKEGGEITVCLDPAQSAITKEQLMALNQSICLHKRMSRVVRTAPIPSLGRCEDCGFVRPLTLIELDICRAHDKQPCACRFIAYDSRCNDTVCVDCGKVSERQIKRMEGYVE